MRSLNVLSPATMVSGKPLLVETVLGLKGLIKLFALKGTVLCQLHASTA